MLVPLNIKTCNSLLKSMIKIKPLIKKAKENNISALTITDNNMYGVIEFYKECKKNNIKPIIGLDIEKLNIIVYAMNYNGYKNLLKITTKISENNINLENLKEYSDNLICILPYENIDLYKQLTCFKKIFVSYKNIEEKNKIPYPKVYMNEILCLEKEDEKYLRYLTCIKKGTTIKNEQQQFQNTSLFPLKEDYENNIADLCNLEIKFHQDLLPIYSEEDGYETLKKQCIKGLKEKFGNTVNSKYQIRLKYELSIIKKMGFCDYFLIVADYVNYAKNNNILVGPGRGSAAGSLVSYLLNITTIDPLKYNLLFERFLNPERVTMPDIDVDFEDCKRDQVVKYCIEKYGPKKVAPIITFGTLKSKAAIKDVARVLEITPAQIEPLTKIINSNINLTENLKNKKINEIIKNNNDLKLVYQIAMKFEGLKRHSSVHAAGIVMSKINLDEIIPLNKHSNFYTTGYDMTHLEELGLLKMDFLGIKNLTMINNIIHDIKTISLDKIPNNDPLAIKIFKEANTIGIFQFESEGMINFLTKFKPTCFEEISSALALYRPGPMKNIDSYIKRRNHQEPIDYLHQDLKQVLAPTYGIIIYQEQIMTIANIMAGYTMAEADMLRRAMSKKKLDILLNEKDKFITQSVNKGYDIKIATKVYNLILKFADYGFNKSHSVSYAMISYKMAYLKAHYPLIFMKNLLSNVIGSEQKTKEYIYECKKNNINIIYPDINKSYCNYIVDKGSILFPLTSIKNIATATAKTIIEERNKKNFTDIFDFTKRCYGKAVNQQTIQYLIMAGTFDNLGINRQTLINNLDLIINYGELGELLDEEMYKPELKQYPEYNKKQLMENDLKTFGFYLKNHPITEYKVKYPKIIPLKDITNYFDKFINTIVYINKIKKITTKNNDEMMFVTGSDETSKIDIVIFPKLYKSSHNIQEEDIIYITGKVEKRFDKFQINATTIKKLN